MKTLCTISLLLITGTLTGQSGLGVFDNHTDIGPVKHSGFAVYDAEEQTYRLGGSGANMWFGEDQFHFLWTTLRGDFILRAEGHFLGAGVDPHRKMGWIVKPDLRSRSEQVSAVVHGDGLTSLQYRQAFGEETRGIPSTDSLPDVIQLERQGNRFIMSTARFGEPLTEVVLEELPMDAYVYVGLFICAHNEDVVETATFRNVRIVQPAPADLQQYQQYLSSKLEVMEVATGHRKVLYHAEHSIQAPNWTLDGRRLIYNSKGLLYTYDLASGRIDPFPTGSLENNNNDHVLTFDGTLLGVSNNEPEHGGASTIYYLPLDGRSGPVRVTDPEAGASYFHGWSPDARQMLFTGRRDGQFDIIAIDVQTGEETKLTDLSTLDDGPEYSPDGQYIFFNSVRSGTMQLYRMKPDGSAVEQLTFDAYNDWFPHVSPDQEWIVFISFPTDIDPSTHPFYKRCLLRMIPYEGGEPRVIGYIYGGQGTINVPSWSPDGKYIAFVTNGAK